MLAAAALLLPVASSSSPAPLTDLRLVIGASSAAPCPSSFTRIAALPGGDGDLNSGAHQPAAWTPSCGAALQAAATSGGNDAAGRMAALLEAGDTPLIEARRRGLELVDELLAFRGAFVGHELLHRRRLGQLANHV